MVIVSMGGPFRVEFSIPTCVFINVKLPENENRCVFVALG